MEETLIIGRTLNKFSILLWNFKARYPANNVPLVYHFLTPINNNTHSRTIFSYRSFWYWFILLSVLYYSKWRLPVSRSFYFPNAYYMPHQSDIRSYYHHSNVMWKSLSEGHPHDTNRYVRQTCGLLCDQNFSCCNRKYTKMMWRPSAPASVPAVAEQCLGSGVRYSVFFVFPYIISFSCVRFPARSSTN
jgi:hypothetical protein